MTNHLETIKNFIANSELGKTLVIDDNNQLRMDDNDRIISIWKRKDVQVAGMGTHSCRMYFSTYVPQFVRIYDDELLHILTVKSFNRRLSLTTIHSDIDVLANAIVNALSN